MPRETEVQPLAGGRARSPRPERLLITGASGFIGGRLREELAGEFRVLGTCCTQPEEPGLVRADLREMEGFARLLDASRPEVVVHAAAVGDPDRCEEDPEAARRVDLEATVALAGLCRERGARLVYFSTDLVFDGAKGLYAESDAPNPINVYGRAKLESERGALAACPDAVVLRVSLVYGLAARGRPTFMDRLHACFGRGEKVRAFADQWRSPTPAAQLPQVLRAILARPELRGVYHWSGAERASRLDYARAFCAVFGFPEKLAVPASMADVPAKAPRPRDTSLESSRLSGALGIRPWTLREGFEAEQRRKRGGESGKAGVGPLSFTS